MKRVTAAVLLFLSAIVLTAQTPSSQSPQPLTEVALKINKSILQTLTKAK